MLRPEGVWTLSQRLDSSGRKGSEHKNGHLGFVDARLSCDKRMAYAAVGGGLNTEPAIRFSGRKGRDTKTGTRTLQDARLPCDKRRAYAAV